MRLIALGFAFLLVLFTGSVFAGDVHKIDPSHSTFGFAVKHMEVGITRGIFTDYSGEVEFDRENLETFHAWAVIKTGSIDTRLVKRDEHLRSEAFFYVEKYPTIIFTSRKIIEKRDGYEIIGSLTMRGGNPESVDTGYYIGPCLKLFRQRGYRHIRRNSCSQAGLWHILERCDAGRRVGCRQ